MILFLLYLLAFIFSDLFIASILGFKGSYFLLHAFHNVLVAFYSFPSVTNALFFHEFYTMDLHLIPLIYALHVYHLLVFYNKINLAEKLHHFLSLGVVIPLVSLFFPNDTSLLGFSFFSTTGIATVLHYVSLFLYKNSLLKKRSVLRIGHMMNTNIRFPLIIANSTCLTQYIVSHYQDFSKEEFLATIILLLILLWNGFYFRFLVETAYYGFCG